MFTARTFKFAGLAISISLLAACNSQFVEKKPDAVSIDTKLSAIMEDKSKIDEKLNSVEEATKRIRRINSLLKRAYNPNGRDADTYSPVDFLIDVNEELKGSIPKKVGDKYVRNTVVNLQIDGLSEECKTVETLLETSEPDALVNELNKAGKADAKVLKYSVRACGTENSFVPLVEVSWEGNQVLLSVNSKNIAKIFNVTASKTINSNNWNCKVSNEPSGIIESVYCENLDITLSKTEVAIVDHMMFNNKGDTRFEADARILEGDKTKATATIVVKSDGDVDYQINKVEQNN